MSKNKLIIMIIKSLLELGVVVLGVAIVSMVAAYIHYGHPYYINRWYWLMRSLVGIACLLHLLTVLRFRFMPYLLSRRK